MRPRRKDRHLPPCVYHRHGAYYLVQGGKWQRLGATLPEALAEYGRRLAPASGGMDAIIDAAMVVICARVAPSTRKGYLDSARTLRHMLAEFSPQSVQPRHVVDLRQALAATPNYANRCLSVLRQIFDYALERQMVESNPCVQVKRLPERKRERLISPAEFARIRDAAPPRLQVIMDLLYLTGQRVGDVLALSRGALLDEGIAFRQQKTGARLLVRWTPDLRAVVERAKALNGNVQALTLLHNRRGKAPDYSTTKGQFTAACRAAGVADAQLRDLRAMSLTAAKAQGRNATALAGHASEAMTARYLRDRQVPVVDGPSFGHVFGQILDDGQKRQQDQ